MEAAALAFCRDGLAHQALGGGLQLRIDAETDDQVRRLGAGDLHRLGRGHVEHIAEVPLAWRLRRQRRRRGQRGLLVGGADPALGAHRGQDDVRAGQGRVHVVGQRQPRRRLGQGGQQRRLLQGQLAGRLAEVGFGGGVDPIGVVAKEDAVEVELQHFVLAHRLFHPPGDHRLLQLAAHGLVGRQEQGLGQLLGQGRAALDGVAGLQVGPQRPGDAAQIDRAVLVKPPVLRRQEGARAHRPAVRSAPPDGRGAGRARRSPCRRGPRRSCPAPGWRSSGCPCRAAAAPGRRTA